MALNNWFIYPQLAEPVTVPQAEVFTEDKWHQPWSEPVRQKIGLAANQQQTTSSFFATPETITEDKWHQPWSIPVKLAKPGLPTSEHPYLFFTPQPDPAKDLAASWIKPLDQPVFRKRLNVSDYFFAPLTVGEIITADKWFNPFSDPYRKQIRPRVTPLPATGIAAPAVALDWLLPLSEPIFRKRLNISDYVFAPARAPEVVTPDKWFEPLSEPTRRVGIQPSQQQALAFAPSPITPSFGWFAPLTEPARRIPRPPISDYVFAPSTVAELITVDKWFEPLAEPAKPKLSIFTASQQAFASIVSPIIPSFGWYAPLAEPTRRVGIQPSQQQALAFVAPIIIPTVVTGWFTSFSDPVWPKRQTSGRPYPFQARSQYISWFTPFSEPVRLKPDLGPYRQQFFAEPAFVPPPFTTFWFTPLSEPVRVPPRLITGSNQDLASLGSPIIPSFGWFEPLSEPTRRVASQASQQALAVPVTTPTAVTTGWLAPLSDPYLRRPDPNRYQGESQFIAVAARVKWFSPLAEPVRTKPSLSIASQPSVAQPVFTPVVSIGWFAPLAEPVRFRAIPVSQRPAFSFAPLPITPSFGWFQPLNEPAKRFNLPAYQQQTLAFGTYSPIIPSFGYFNPLSQFPGVRRSLLAAHQQFWTYGTPAIIVTIQAGMAVIEQGDFLQAVLYQFNIPLTCYVDIIEKNPHYVGDAGIIEKGQQQGILASIVEPVPVGAGGAAVPQVAGARVAIISAANPNIPLRPPPPGFTYLLGADGSYLKGADGSYLLAPI